jgi:hypothetical protein
MNMQITNNNKKCSESHAQVRLEARSSAAVKQTAGVQQSLPSNFTNQTLMQTQLLENDHIDQPLLIRHSLTVANFNTMGSTNFTDASPAARHDRELSYQVPTHVHTEVNDSHSIDSEN